MADITVGQPAPDFELRSTQGEVRLAALRGRSVLVAFYQEDSTPACSAQLAAFAEDIDTLEELGATVIAISVDDLARHERFRGQLGDLPFPLATDPDLAAATSYGVVDETGKRSRRAVFVIDPDGMVALAIPWYNPSNFDQYEQIYRALGMDI